ncbi:MAG TPA: class I SAM-dependent methyltransferase [Candidatus Eisenbacteria bacterium]|nr:class I SAM-dependent methyltransferase [Candidatus Eisenbacteria bacterium]
MLSFRSRRNNQVWRDPAVVAEYARAADLQPAERTVLALLEPALASMDMLDIGVGGGRTALHFAHRMRLYVGIDYSPEMIAACRARLAPARNYRLCGVRRQGARLFFGR